MKAFRKELAQRLGRALIKSSHHFRFRANRTLPRHGPRAAFDPFRTSVRAGANLDSERFRSGPKTELNGHGISRDV
jgi:hypothetical protein